MKKTLLLTFLMLGTSSAFASAQDYIGRYELRSEVVTGDAFCFQGLIIAQEGREMALYRSDITSMAMFKAEVNGSREVSYSHGEAMTSTKGKDSVTLKSDGTLIFQFSGVVKVMGIPSGRTQDGISLNLSSDRKTLTAVRKVSETFGNKGEARCVYVKE